MKKKVTTIQYVNDTKITAKWRVSLVLMTPLDPEVHHDLLLHLTPKKTADLATLSTSADRVLSCRPKTSEVMNNSRHPWESSEVTDAANNKQLQKQLTNCSM